MTREIDIIIIGGGKAVLACAYFLKRRNLNFIILDAGNEANNYLAPVEFEEVNRKSLKYA